MNKIADLTVLTAFIVFCRVAGAVMAMPGFGSERVPTRIRLAIAVCVTVMLAPALWSVVVATLQSADGARMVGIIFTEIAIGVVIGITARMFFLALEGMAAAAATSIGLSNVLGVRISESEAVPTMATLIVLGATTLLFALDIHWELLRGLRQSYDVIPVGDGLNPEATLRELIRSLDQAFGAMLRICSPVLILALILNVSFGILNRMSPQVPVYFVSAPFLVAIGVYWIYMLLPDFFAGFISAFSEWLKS